MPKNVPSYESQEMLRLYTTEGATYTQISEAYGLSHQRVGQRLRPLLTPELKKLTKAGRSQLRAEKQEAALAPLRSQMEELVRAGLTNPEIERQLNIDRPTCRALMAGLSPIEHKRRRAAKQTETDTYSLEEKLAAVCEAAMLNGGRIGVAVYRKLRTTHPHWPSADLLKAGGWNWLLREAGVPTSAAPRNCGLPRYSEEECRKATQRVAQVAGGIYSIARYDTLHLASEPSSGTLRLHYGGGKRRWVQALEYLVPRLFEESSTTP